jgi:hypothetical protein
MLPVLTSPATGTMNVLAISGPTHQQQTPFVWTAKYHDKHVGQPDEWNFDWRVISSQSNK